jgi:flagellar hook-associated protein FlgK
MGSAFSGINVLVSALRAQTMAQQIIQNNIANSMTAGYTRQNAILASVAPLNLPSFNSVFAPGQIGMGVTLQSIARIRDEFLDLQIRRELAVAGRESALADAAKSLAIIYPELGTTPGSGLVTALETFFADMAAVGAAPTDAGLRATAVADANALAGFLNDAYKTVSSLQNSIDDKVRDAMSQVNVLLARVAEINKSVVMATAAGGSANALLDARDNALAELARLINIDTVKLGDGSVLVMTGNARVLVKGGEASRLVAGIYGHETRFASVELRNSMNEKVADITREVTAGALGGRLLARDGMAADQMLELDELASSLIDVANLVHRAGYASDGTTTNIALFTGTEARDIAVDLSITANPGLLAASGAYGDTADGTQATTLGKLRDLVMNAYVQSVGRIDTLMGTVDPTQAMNSVAHTALNGSILASSNATNFLVAPSVSGTLVVNGVSINWTNTDSLDTVIARINSSGAGVRAGFDFTQQRLTLLGNGPITVYDSAGNLTRSLRLQTRINSLAPMNNGIGPADRPIVTTNALSAGQLEYRTLSGVGGAIQVNGVAINWTEGQSLSWIGGVIPSINAALAGAGVRFTFGFTAATQKAYIVGTQTLPATAAAPVGPVTMRDTQGNLLMVMNMEAQPAFGQFGDTMLAQMQAQLSNSEAVADQAGSAVDQLQAQQDAISKVNLDEEKARLLEYLRAYEAAVRAMAAMDEMLNVLINRTAVSTMGSGTSSVMTS